LPAIRAGDGSGYQSQTHRRFVQEEQQQGRERAKCGRDRHRLERTHVAAGDHAIGGALHIAVKPEVGRIIDGAAGRAHQERAKHEHRDQQRARHAIRRNPERSEGGPQQQQGADRLVQAD